METALKNQISSSVNSHASYPSHLKSLESHHAKSYKSSAAGDGGNSEDIPLPIRQDAWLTKAKDYLDKIEHGVLPQPTQAEMDDLLTQMDWVKQQLAENPSNYGDSDPTGLLYGDEYSDQENSQPSTNEFGGMCGPNQNWVYNESDSHIYFNGDPTRNDIWAYNNTVEVPSTSAKVSYEVTSDGLNPANQVLRVRVTDPALQDPNTGGPLVTEYFYHNFQDPDFKLKITAPKTSAITGSSLPTVTTGVFKAGSAKDQGPESNVEGTLVEGTENHYYYEGTVGQTMEFAPVGSGTSGDDTIHEPYGDSNISVKTTDKVAVAKSTEAGYEYVVTVTHKDGSTDTFHIHKEFKCNLNAVKDFVTFTDATGDHVGEVPTGFSKIFSLNSGSVGDSGKNGLVSDKFPADDQPTELSEDGKTGLYTKDGPIDIHTDFDSKVRTHHIQANGNDVTIHVDSMLNDFVKVEKLGDKYIITVYRDNKTGPENEITYEVTGNPSKIIIDTLNEPGKVIYINSDLNNDVKKDPKIQIGLGEPTKSEDDFEYSLHKIENHMHFVNGGNADTASQAIELMHRIDAAIKSGKSEDWDKVEDYLLDTKTLPDNTANNVINTFIWGLVSAYGEAGAKNILKKMSPDLRDSMVQRLMAENRPAETLAEAGSANPTYKDKTVADTVNFIEGVDEDSNSNE